MSPSRRNPDLNTQRPLLEVFRDIGRTLTSTRSLTEVLDALMQQVSALLAPKDWSLLLLDPGTRDLVFEIAVGEKADGLIGLRIPMGKGICGWVAEKGEPLLIDDVAKDPRFYRKMDEQTQFHTQSIVCVPLKSKGNVLGVIELINVLDTEKTGRSIFSVGDLELLTVLADFAAIAIENARHLERIQTLVTTDDVTGLFNMRYMEDVLEREFSRARRYRLPFCLIFMDLDRFKTVNDRFGHLLGSAVLRQTAQLIKSNLRDSDVAIRYGGDEFVVLLPQTGRTAGEGVAERIRRTIEAFDFRDERDAAFRLTSSLGVAAFPDDAGTKTELIRRADQSLYRAKECGRNCVRFPE